MVPWEVTALGECCGRHPGSCHRCCRPAHGRIEVVEYEGEREGLGLGSRVQPSLTSPADPQRNVGGPGTTPLAC
ncbi:MAG TPA: hypothetical protein VM537_00830 [Anaerolineae bacterium]|nr:hypothetical protein [Anaerolineae bacterium]